MRPIKFRVWHKPEQKMHHYLKAKFGKATNITLEGKFKDVDHITTKTVPVDDLEIMQFTGLVDKNGEEIFEGDVVKLFGNETVSQVYFKDGSFLIDEPEKKTLLFSILCEVIGNIHEHPEILKQGFPALANVVREFKETEIEERKKNIEAYELRSL